MADDVEANKADGTPVDSVADGQRDAGGHATPVGTSGDDVNPSPDVPKLGKQRGGRRKKGTGVAAAAELQAPKKRGRRKAGVADQEAEQGAVPRRAKRAATSTTVAAEPVASTAVSDEFEELLQLEQENQRLRQLLATKLRDENAELRKRLGLS